MRVGDGILRAAPPPAAAVATMAAGASPRKAETVKVNETQGAKISLLPTQPWLHLF